MASNVAKKELGKVYMMILMKGWSSIQIKLGDIFVRQIISKKSNKKDHPLLKVSLENYFKFCYKYFAT